MNDRTVSPLVNPTCTPQETENWLYFPRTWTMGFPPMFTLFKTWMNSLSKWFLKLFFLLSENFRLAGSSWRLIFSSTDFSVISFQLKLLGPDYATGCLKSLKIGVSPMHSSVTTTVQLTFVTTSIGLFWSILAHWIFFCIKSYYHMNMNVM